MNISENQAVASSETFLETSVIVLPGRMVYMEIPAEQIRKFVDSLLPGLAKNPLADIATGWGHRHNAGHDLLIDVSKTIMEHGPWQGIRQAGHILLTDFPTKHGIPIPGFSKPGLGQYVEQLGVDWRWMQINLPDAGIGYLAIADGSNDLALALCGSLEMDWGTFFDTFVEGGAEIGFALFHQNPLLLAAGIENVMAGLGATWNTLSHYVDPLDFFGSAGTSSLIGFCLASGLAGENLSDSGKDAIRSGAIGSLYCLSPAFGYGALAGFTAYRLGSALAENHNKAMNACLSINERSYGMLVEEICRENIPVKEMLERALPILTLSDDAPQILTQACTLTSTTRTLPDSVPIFQTNTVILTNDAPTIATKAPTLLDDPPILSDVYRAALMEGSGTT